MVTRKPLALSNWKMAMTIAQSLAFVRDFPAMAGEGLEAVQVVVCPPFTAIWAVAQALDDHRIQLGGQNIAPTEDPARTGQVSAKLLADLGCRWVMLGHWEVRRYLGDDDATVNRKVHLALQAGLSPILLIGEGRDEAPSPETLARRLERVLAGCGPEQVADMAFVYEPEQAIGAKAPASSEQVAAGCGFIRGWLRRRWGEAVAGRVRIIYGGSVSAEHAAALLASPEVDGLGATRRGRDAATFAEIVRLIGRCRQ